MIKLPITPVDVVFFNKMVPSCSHLQGQDFLLSAESRPQPTRYQALRVSGVFLQLYQCVLNRSDPHQGIPEVWSTAGWSQTGDLNICKQK